MTVTRIDPASALVLIDFQEGIHALAAPGLVAPATRAAGRLATAFRSRGLPVILVRTTFSADGGDAPRNRVTAPPVVRSRPARGTEALAGLATEPTDLVVWKRQTGAFHGTDLDLQLRRRGRTGIVLGGLFTSYAVESTGRAAFDLGYNVTFAVDAMADLDPADHGHSVGAIFPRIGEVGDAAAIETLLAQAAAG